MNLDNPGIDPAYPSSTTASAPMAAAPPPPLAYRDVRDDRKGGTRRFLLLMLGGFCAAVLVCAGCFALLFAVGARYGGGTGPLPPAVAWGSLTFVTGVLVGLIWWAIRAHRRRSRTGFLVGMLIGVGLCLLPLGMCYAIIGGEAIR